VTGFPFPVQVAVQGMLDPDENMWIRSLHANLGKEDVERLVVQGQKIKQKAHTAMDAYMETIFRANQGKLKKGMTPKWKKR